MNTTLPHHLSSECTIRFSDCDPFGHLNNARYIDYLINVREEQILAAYGLNLYDHYQKGCGWVVNSHEIIYLKPARVSERVLIHSSLIELGESHVTVEISMTDLDRTQLKAVMWSRFTYINLQKVKKEAHSEDLMQLFNQILDKDVAIQDGLQNRIITYKSTLNVSSNA